MPQISSKTSKPVLRALFSALWLAFLALPILVFRVNSISGIIEYQWSRLPKLLAAGFLASLLWNYFQKRHLLKQESPKAGSSSAGPPITWADRFLARTDRYRWLSLLGFGLMVLPFFCSPYAVKILTTALIYITLGLGLNIVVGVSGLLHLGYAAFFAVGAYVYGLLNYYFGWGFWVCLPLGTLSAALAGLLLGLPVIRLTGDYLAIVTLGFGEIVRLLLTNSSLTMGPRGIGNIPPPGFFGLDLNEKFRPFLVEHLALNPYMDLNKIWIYLIILLIVVLTTIAALRLENSRLGRAWLALREDETACQSVGISPSQAKLTALTLGSSFAGLAGVVFAAQITFIAPSSFSFMDSIYILTIVVLGGMGSISGVIAGAAVISCLPEFLREAEEYRFLIFGALMVLMMVYRPQGLIRSVRSVCSRS
ncbi:MAG: high-affinity branched-chain amino acid ABC transporter permease LivM [Deltaproteobacteria bacterium]|jgi:branched-chain amino acid transport system permease protein|nr:high-affinity branched-chain amino acid ABC transporter permease LivM [Deltaproteobacteria bacterium]